MLNIDNVPRIKGFRFPKSVIGYAVWVYHRFALSLRDVEDLLAERGVSVSYETIREWVNRFGHQFAARIRRDRPVPADKWHLDEVVIRIKGKIHWLWRAIDANGDVLDILVQSRWNKAAAKRFLFKLPTLERAARYGDGQASLLWSR
jgi:putative transposase